MGKQKIKVTTKWGPKDSKDDIKIKADTLAGALDALTKRPGNEWGKFEGDIGFPYSTTNKKVDAVELQPSWHISLPTWSGYSKAPKECQKEWDRMYKALVEHEDGHADVHKEILKEAEKWLGKQEDLSEKDLSKGLEKIIKTGGKKKQDGFDGKNGHGSQKGVNLKITEECQ